MVALEQWKMKESINRRHVAHRTDAFEPSWQPTIAPSPCSVEPALLAATSFGICVITTSPSESRQGIQRDTDCLGLMIRNFNPSRLTFKTTGQPWTRLPALSHCNRRNNLFPIAFSR